MIALWSSFARSGVPSAPGLTWPRYPAFARDAGASGLDAGDAGTQPPGVLPDPYMALDVQAATGDGARTTFCDFWDLQP